MYRLYITVLLFISAVIFFPLVSCGEKDERLSRKDRLLQNRSNKTVLESGVTIEDLAYHWAPVHYQDINPVGSDRSRVDYITRIDRDLPGREGGDWNISRNWNRRLPFPLRAYVYYSVVASKTHYFIGYYFYHPLQGVVYRFPDGVDCICRNYIPGTSECADSEDCRVRYVKKRSWKNNDLEGALLVIKKSSSFGKLEAVFVQSHGNIGTYFPAGNSIKMKSISEGANLVNFSDEAKISMNDNVSRIITAAQEGGHGVGCYPQWWYKSYIVDPRTAGGGDHIRYIPSRTKAEEPDFESIYNNSNKGRYSYSRYKLINVFDPDGGFWMQRYNEAVFVQKGYNITFKGSHGDPPWLWHGTGDNVKSRLSGEEIKLVSGSGHPFTHNPANLCRVYLSVYDGPSNKKIDSREYFSDIYDWNQFINDPLPVVK